MVKKSLKNVGYNEWDLLNKRELKMLLVGKWKKTHGSHRDTSIQNENKNNTFRNSPDA